MAVPPDKKTLEVIRMIRISEEHHTQDIGEFLEESKYQLGEWVVCTPKFHGGVIEEFSDCPEEEHFVPVKKTVEEVLAEHFEIDLNKVEQERRELLESIRKEKNEGADGPGS